MKNEEFNLQLNCCEKNKTKNISIIYCTIINDTIQETTDLKNDVHKVVVP